MAANAVAAIMATPSVWFGSLLMRAFATVEPDRGRRWQQQNAAEWQDVARDAAEGTLDCMEIRR
jgi:hypothetical protein